MDVCFGTHPDGKGENQHSSYVTKLKEHLQKAYLMAAEASNKTHLRNKKAYDKRLGFQSLEPGDRVLLKNLGLRGKHKLENRWCDVPYVIVENMPNLPVYKVKPQSGKGKLKTLHRDNLLPIGDFVRFPVLDNTEDAQLRSTTRVNDHKRNKSATTDHSIQIEHGTSTESSDLECDRPHRPYRTYLEKIIRRREETNTGRQEQTGIHTPLNNSRSERENTPLEDNDPDTESELESTSSEEEDRHQASLPDIKVTPKQARPKRRVKPVVRLTYDEPGKARDQPLTIVHRGVTIKIGKS